MYDFAIIGSGVTGYGAAMYGARLEMRTVVVGDEEGGTITLTDEVSNYPGFIELTGTELAEKLKKHALDYPVHLETGRVIDLFRCEEGCFYLVTKSKTYVSRTVLIATGMEDRELDVPGHNEFRNKGVSYCALCDGPIFRDKEVAVVGGSDSAAKEALLLTKYCKKVYMIYRGDKIRPEPINAERVAKSDDIEVITNTNVTEIYGDMSVSGVKLDNPYNGSDTLAVEGVFIAIGGIPNSELAKKIGVNVNDKDEIVINRNSETNVEAVFAAGDVVDTEFKQAITGVAEGVHAAYQAFRYVNENEFIYSRQHKE